MTTRSHANPDPGTLELVCEMLAALNKDRLELEVSSAKLYDDAAPAGQYIVTLWDGSTPAVVRCEGHGLLTAIALLRESRIKERRGR